MGENLNLGGFSVTVKPEKKGFNLRYGVIPNQLANMLRQKIKEAMAAQNLKSKDLAELVGISYASLSQFFSGKIELNSARIEKMFEILELKIVK